jgi:subtilisin family serine protease
MPSTSAFDEKLHLTPEREMSLDPSRLLLNFKISFDEKKRDWREMALRKISQMLTGTGVVIEQDPPSTTDHEHPQQLINHTGRLFWVHSMSGSSVTNEALQALSSKEWLEWYAPVYRLTDKEGRGRLVCPLPDLVVVPTRSARETLGIDQFNVRNNLSAKFDLDEVSDERDDHESPDHSRPRLKKDYRAYRARKPRERSAYRTLRELREQENTWAKDASFALIPMVRPIVEGTFPDVPPNDPSYSQQWNLPRIGADIAWRDTQGNPGIVIAIIDEGCDFGHPEFDRLNTDGTTNFRAALVDGATFYSDSTQVPGEVGDCSLVPSQSHGTKCAGIIGAQINNQQAIAGLAPDCKILPIRLDGGMTSISLARAIRFAVTNSAHPAKVISISLADAAYSAVEVAEAIEFAYDSGVVVCCATGNDNVGNVDYPAAYASEGWVIACGACNNRDERCTSFTNWNPSQGSNYGTGISVVAPGNDIPTIINNNNGRSGRSILNFSGTSAAAPHVAGVAALLLSVDAQLSPTQVRDIIEQSAEPINDNQNGEIAGKYYYYDFQLSRHPNKGWNEKVGYGLVRADRALDILQGRSLTP